MQMNLITSLVVVERSKIIDKPIIHRNTHFASSLETKHLLDQETIFVFMITQLILVVLNTALQQHPQIHYGIQSIQGMITGSPLLQ